jgi:lysozyme
MTGAFGSGYMAGSVNQNGRFGRVKNLRFAAIALAVLLGAFVLWRVVAGWSPSRDDFPVQGIVVNASNGQPEWTKLAATGVDFAYLIATRGDKQRDPNFAANLEGVRDAGIRHGALHVFDICRLASDQATLFITTVPRSATALPEAVSLDFSDTCSSKPDRALVLSEIATFLSQIEAHTGIPAVLLISPDFEQQYRISEAVNRNVWLERTWLLPDYAAKPWVMWTANPARSVDGIDGRVPWVVVRGD